MSGSRLLIGVASVLAGTTVLLGVFGLVYNPVLVVAAVPFAAATYLLFSHGTGRLEAQMRERFRHQRAGRSSRSVGRRGRTDQRDTPCEADARRGSGSPEGERTADDAAAARVLGVAPDADDATIRAAFRARARAHHPDAPGGDEAAFRRARAAYEQLTGRQ